MARVAQSADAARNAAGLASRGGWVQGGRKEREDALTGGPGWSAGARGERWSER